MKTILSTQLTSATGSTTSLPDLGKTHMFYAAGEIFPRLEVAAIRNGRRPQIHKEKERNPSEERQILLAYLARLHPFTRHNKANL